MEIRSFNDIIGNEDLIRHLKSAAGQDRISHAYILSGPTGSGKKTIASLFAAAILCAERKGDPCGSCESCRKAFTNNHPDIVYVTHEKPNVISVDEIRGQVVETAPVKPYESRYKVYIIADADKMNPQAQNALLKTIEEPPEYVVILLLTVNEEILLPTIVSRCVLLQTKPVPREKIQGYLENELHVPEYEAEVAASFAQGNLGRAKAAVMSDEFLEMVREAVGFLIHIRNMNSEECMIEAERLAGQRQGVNDYLDIFTLWFRDVLMFKATQDPETVIFSRHIEDIRDQASKSSYEGLQLILQAIDKAKTRLRANVSFEVTMELLFMTIMEN